MKRVKIDLILLATAVLFNGCLKDDAAVRIPKNHRPFESKCPEQRGPNSVSVDQCKDKPMAGITCEKDSDCTEGTNGRCVSGGGPACQTWCTYDTCFSDADCPDDQPCECRSSSSSNEENMCMTEGNCRVDADCGASGYCSPSLVRDLGGCWGVEPCWPDPDSGGYCAQDGVKVPCQCEVNCGHGYFCHTPNDSCTDDSDCEGGVCAYRTEDNLWSCSIPRGV